jgi:hypothetical protein
MITLAFILATILVAGYFKAQLDAIADSGIKSNEWKNKYKLNENGNLVSADTQDHWWYFGLYKPRFAEKFPFSSTALVFMTDKWHKAQFFMYRFLFLGMSFSLTSNFLFISILTFILFPIAMGVSFEFFYGKKRETYAEDNSTKMKVKEVVSVNLDEVNYVEHPNYEHHTSVPEKQIEDLEQ